MWVMHSLILAYLETEIASVHDRHVVCVKGTIGLEIVLDAPGGIPR
jgi:hypothetical protein